MDMFLFKIIIVLIIVGLLLFILNIPLSSRKGIDYKWQTIKIPLYLKILDFFDRHFNYCQLTKSIVKGCRSDEEMALAIFRWTYNNIKRVPEGFPVIDDHVWHIIVRGYGTSDQACYVFSTICNYAGIRSFYSKMRTKDGNNEKILSFVNLGRNWSIFDPYSGVYFRNKEGALASIEDLKNNKWIMENISDIDLIPDYSKYFDNLNEIKDFNLDRSNIQSPLNRIKFFLRRKTKI